MFQSLTRAQAYARDRSLPITLLGTTGAGCVLVPSWLCPASPSQEVAADLAQASPLSQMGERRRHLRGTWVCPQEVPVVIVPASVSSSVKWGCDVWAPSGSEGGLVFEERVYTGWRSGSLEEQRKV